MSKLYKIPISENQRRQKASDDKFAADLQKLQQEISAEQDNRIGADATLTQALTNLNDKVDNAVSGNNSAIDSTKSELNEKIDNAVSRIDEDIETVDANQLAESTRAKTRENEIETKLTQQIEAEKSARALADVNLTTQMKALNDAEVEARKKSDDDLSAKIAQEITDRNESENSIRTTIQNNVNNLAPKNNPIFTGTPLVPEVSDNTPDKQIATVKFVKDKAAEVNNKLVIFTKATSTADGQPGLVPAQGKTSKKQILTSDGWANMDAAGMTLALPTQNGKLTYNGNSQTPSWNNYDPAKIKIEVTAQTDAGTYIAKATPLGLYVWSDSEKQETRDIYWTIDPMLLPKPAASATQFTFNNQTQSITVSNFDATYITQTGTISASDANTYEATYSLKNTSNTKWSDGSTDAVKIIWNIAILKIDKPTASGQTEFDYDKDVHAPTIANFNTTYINRTGTYSTADAGEYTITFAIKQPGNVHWRDNSTSNVSIAWKIVVRELDKPTLSVDNFTFSYANNNGAGTFHSVSILNFDDRFMTKSGVETASDAGVYQITITLKDEKYSWKDKTKTAIVLTWQVNRAKISVPTLSSETANFTGSYIYLQLKDFGQNWLNGKTSGTSKSTWTTNLGIGLSSQNETVYVLNAGTYTFSITPDKNHCWQDNSFDAKIFNFTVNKQTVTKPTISGGGDFKNADYTIQWTNFNATLMTKSGTETAKNAGEYTITVALIDSNNYEWTGGNSEPIVFTWRINRAKLSDAQSNLYQETPFVYSGNTLTFIPKNYDANVHVLSGELSAKNAGTYYATVNVDANHLWNNGTSTPKTVQWRIDQAGTVTKPTAPSTQILFTNSEVELQIDGFDPAYVKKTAGTLKAIAVGTYSVTFSLIDKDNYTWADGTTADIVIVWSIVKKTIAEPVIKTRSFTFSPNTSRAPVFTAAFDSENIVLRGDVSAIDAGNYTIICALKDKILTTWQDGTVDDREFSWIINPKKLTNAQSNLTQNGTLTYNGSAQTVKFKNQSTTYHVFSGVTESSEAGTHTAFVEPAKNYAFDDGTTAKRALQWVIGKLYLAKPTVTSATEFIFDNTQKSLTFSNYNTTHIKVTGTQSAVEDKNYTVTFSLINPNSTAWISDSDEDDNANIVYNWSIVKTRIKKPVLNKTVFYASIDDSGDKAVFVPSLSNYDSDTVTFEPMSVTDVGEYNFKVSLVHKDLHLWDDGSADDLNLPFHVNYNAIIGVNFYNATNFTQTFTYTGEDIPVTTNIDFFSSNSTPDDNRVYEKHLFIHPEDDIPKAVTNMTDIFERPTVVKDAGTYTYKVKPSSNFYWQNNHVNEVRTFTLVVKPITITAPTVSDEVELVYNGTTSSNGKMQSVPLVGFDSDTMILGGTYQASDAGVYSATVTPKPNHAWNDGSDLPITLIWSIAEKPLTATQSNISVEGEYPFTGEVYSLSVKNSNQRYHTTNANRQPLSTATSKLEISTIWMPTLTVYATKNFCFNDNTTSKKIAVNFKPKILNRPVFSSPRYFKYDGNVHTATLDYDPEWIEITDNSVLSASEEKAYHVYYKLKPDKYTGNGVGSSNSDGRCIWSDTKTLVYAKTPVDMTWRIGELTPYPKPTLKQDIFTYDGKEHSVEIEGFDSSVMSLTGTTSSSEAGEHSFTIKLKNKSPYTMIWDDTTQTTSISGVTYKWYIVGDEVTMPTITSATEFTYNGSEKKITLSSYNGNKIIQGGYLSATDAGTYTITFTPAAGCIWADTHNAETRSLTWTILPKPLSATYSTFSQKSVLTYNAAAQTVTIKNYNATYHILSGVTTAKDAGEYSAIVSCLPNYVFNDGTTSKTVVWTIRATTIAKPKLSANSYTYTGDNPVSFTNLNENMVDVTYRRDGNVVTTFDAGSYTVTIALKSAVNTQWSDGTTADVVLAFTVVPLKLTKPTISPSSFTFADKTYNINDYLVNFESKYMLLSGNTAQVNVGSYNAVITLKNTVNTTWSDGKTAALTLPWSITRLKLSTKLSDPRVYGTMHFNNTLQTVNLTGYDANVHVLGGEYQAVYAGDYVATVAPDSNHAWSDGTFAPKSVPWTMLKSPLTMPALGDNSILYYDGKEKYAIDIVTYTTKKYFNEYAEKVNVTGTLHASACGNYSITFTIVDKDNYRWAHSDEDVTLAWSIVISGFVKPTITADLTYNGNEQSPAINDFVSDFMTVSGATSKVDAGTYSITVALKDKVNTKWNDNTTANIVLKWKINRKSTGVASNTSLTNADLPYNGQEQTFFSSVFLPDYFNITGTTKADEVGTYPITVTPKANYCWTDGTVQGISTAWRIVKAQPYIQVKKLNNNLEITDVIVSRLTLNGESTFNYCDDNGFLSNIFKVVTNGDGRLFSESSDGNLISVVGETRDKISIIRNGEVTITIGITEGAHYLAASTTMVISANINLETASWKFIAKNASRLQPFYNSSYYGNDCIFKIGDTKTVSGNVKATLIGWCHNEQLESADTIHFAVFNAGLTGKHHTTAVNTGGWKNSDIRTYLNNTYLTSLPSDLQAVIKAIDKYTDNNDGKSVGKTTDKLWLMSHNEVTGNNVYVEKDYTERYEYFVNGNNPRVQTWLRTPNPANDGKFAATMNTLTTGAPAVDANTELPFWPCFAVA